MINVDELTIAQAKQIAAIAGCLAAPAKDGAPTGGRYVVVVDRGWIFAGDLSRTADGYVRITNAVHVFRWEEIGFAKMLEDWRSKKVDLRPLIDVEIPEDVIIFRVPVATDWGKR